MKLINIIVFGVAILASQSAFANSPPPMNVETLGTWIETLLSAPEEPATTDNNGREIKIEDPSA